MFFRNGDLIDTENPKIILDQEMNQAAFIQDSNIANKCYYLIISKVIFCFKRIFMMLNFNENDK